MKKYGLPTCDVCKPVTLPSDVYLLMYFQCLHHLLDLVPNGDSYKDLESMYGNETEEEYCPSTIKALAKAGGMPYTIHTQCSTVKNIYLGIRCQECKKRMQNTI